MMKIYLINMINNFPSNTNNFPNTKNISKSHENSAEETNNTFHLILFTKKKPLANKAFLVKIIIINGFNNNNKQKNLELL